MSRGLRHFSCSQPSGHFPGSYCKDVMPGGMAHVDAVGRYDSVVALDKVTDIGGNQRIRSPGDRSVDDATVLQIEAWGKSRQIVRIVDRHSGVSSRDRPAAQHDVRKVAGWPEARNGFDERYEPSRRVEARAFSGQDLQQPRQHGVGDDQLNWPNGGAPILDGLDNILRYRAS